MQRITRSILPFLLAAPLIFSLRIERIWDKVEAGKHEFKLDSEFLGSVAARYPIQGHLSAIGAAGYRFQAEEPRYSIGLEYQFSYERR